jgi:hypothetical protein
MTTKSIALKTNLRTSLASIWKTRRLSARSLDLFIQGIEYFFATLFIFSIYAGSLLYILPIYLIGFPEQLLVGGIVFLAFVYILIYGIMACRSFEISSLTYRIDLMAADIERLEHNTASSYTEELAQSVDKLTDRLEQTNKDCPFTDPD